MTAHRITPTEYTAQVWTLLHTSDAETISDKVMHLTDAAIKCLRKEDIEEYEHITKALRTFHRKLRVESMVDNVKYMFSGPNFIEEMRISRHISKERRKEERAARKKK